MVNARERKSFLYTVVTALVAVMATAAKLRLPGAHEGLPYRYYQMFD